MTCVYRNAIYKYIYCKPIYFAGILFLVEPSLALFGAIYLYFLVIF